MRVLLIVAHHFRGEDNPLYSSTNERLREHRRNSLARVLASWRAYFQEAAVLDIERHATELAPSSVATLDIVVTVNGDNHLLDSNFERSLGVVRAPVTLENPRMLPFAAHQVMSDNIGRYDWYVYSEDDILVQDGSFFAKLAAFQRRFGMRRLLMPNRYEINPKGVRLKTYVDGALRSSLVERFFALVADEARELVHETEWGALRFARARNPHSGMFALSAEQLAHWRAQPHFLDLDCSFFSPLESAATLAPMKTFSVWKAAAPHLHHLEVEHLDTKFSNLRLPIVHQGG